MSKEQLREIQDKYDMRADDFNLIPQEVEWLIEQAERAHELEEREKELEGYIRYLKDDKDALQSMLELYREELNNHY